MRKNKAAFKDLLEKKDQLTKEETQKIQQLVIHSGGLDEAKRLAEKYTDKALKRIDQLPDSSEKEMIRNLTLSLLDRTI